MRSTAKFPSTNNSPYANSIPWGEVQLDDSDDGQEIESDVHDEQSDSSDDNDYMNDCDDSVVSESEHEHALDGDVKEDALEIPEEFLLAKPQELDVEDELEGDFNRYFNAAFGDANQGNWAFSFQEDEFQEDLRGASGIGKRRRARMRRPAVWSGPRLSDEAGKIFGEAVFAVSGGDYQAAVPKFQEVIRREPKHQQSWSGLATCYEALGDLGKALEIEIMVAHMTTDADTWRNLAEKSKSRSLTQQALYCYRKVCRLLPTDIDAYWECAMLQKEAVQPKEALRTFLAMIKFSMHNMTVIDELLPLLSRLRDWKKGIEILQNAFDHFRAKYPHGPPSAPVLDRNVDPALQNDAEAPFRDVHIVALADYYLLLQYYDKAVLAIRNGARWLQGRRMEMHWEGLPDDREFDMDPGVRKDDGLLGGGPGAQSGMHPLDVNMRHRLARARIKMGDHEEGKMHAGIVLREDPALFGELFAELADAYVEQALFADALGIYSVLLDADQVSVEVAMQAGLCHQRLGKLEEAQSLFECIINVNPEFRDAKMRLAEVYEVQGEPAKALELVREIIDTRRKGTPTPTPWQPGQKLKHATRQKYDNAYKEERRIEREEWLRREAAKEMLVRNVFKHSHELESVDIEDQERVDRWLAEISVLVDDFRECRELFPVNRWRLARSIRNAKMLEGELEEENMLERLENEVGKEMGMEKSRPVDLLPKGYRGVSFQDWLELIVKYAIFLTARGQDELANEILQHVKQSYPFTLDKQFRNTLSIAVITIALYTSNQARISAEGRHLYLFNQFSSEPFRIMTAALESGLRGTDEFLSNNLMKWVTRQDRQWNAAAKLANRQKAREGGVDENPIPAQDSLKWNPILSRWITDQGRGKRGGESGEEEGSTTTDEEPAPSPKSNIRSTFPKSTDKVPLPTRPSAIPRVVHGFMLSTGKSTQGAMYYFQTIYEQHRDDPVLNLAFAIACIGRAMTRIVDNRHYMIAQGAAYLEHYRKYRQPSNLAMQEIEYNFGRFFHQLNLGSFAVKHYLHVLELAGEQQQEFPEDEGFGPEAAYNLSLIYVLSGATNLAKQLYRRWLSI